MLNRQVSAAIVTALLLPTMALGGEHEDLENLRSTTLSLVDALVKQGVLNEERAQAIMEQAKIKTPPSEAEVAAHDSNAAATPGVVRVPYVPQFIRDQIRDQIKDEVVAQARDEHWGVPGAYPAWLDRISWDGDLRVRYQGDYFADNNVPAAFLQANGFNIDNTSEDRQRGRVRLRLGMNAKVNDEWLAGVRLATGNRNDPVSTNQTLGVGGAKDRFGNPDANGDRFSFFVDRAFLSYSPSSWLQGWAGRYANPFFSTPLVWDEDINLDGAAVTIKPSIGQSFKPFATVAAVPIEEVNLSGHDKWMFGGQIGAELAPNSRWKFKLGAAYYDYRNVLGHVNPPGSTINNYTASNFRQFGNSLFDIDPNPASRLFALASDYDEFNVTGSLDIAAFGDTHVILTGDYVRNVAFDRERTLALAGGLPYEPGDTGYLARVTVGAPVIHNRKDWQVSLEYEYLESDAVLDAFTDSDFHLGGTNAKGYILTAAYGLGKNLWAEARFLSADQISGPSYGVDVVQIDLNSRF